MFIYTRGRTCEATQLLRELDRSRLNSEYTRESATGVTDLTDILYRHSEKFVSSDHHSENSVSSADHHPKSLGPVSSDRHSEKCGDLVVRPQDLCRTNLWFKCNSPLERLPCTYCSGRIRPSDLGCQIANPDSNSDRIFACSNNFIALSRKVIGGTQARNAGCVA